MVVKKVKQMDTKGTVTEYEFGADAKNVTEDDTHKFVTATEKQEWDAVKAPTFSESSSLTKLTSGEKLATAMGKIAKGISSLIDHLGNKSNPHGVSKSQVGLGNVDNTSDENKPISTATQKAIDALNTELANYWKKIYPVGSIYMSVNDENPGSLFGGTWVAWGTGRVPVGINTSDGNFNTVEKTGGSQTHTHNAATSGAYSGTSGGTSGTSGAYSGTSGKATGNTGAATGNTGSTTLNINQIPSHSHSMAAVMQWPTSASGWGYSDAYWNSGQNPAIANLKTTNAAGGGQGHTHSLNSHTHSLNSHTHSIPSHTHSLPSHTHSIPSHTHSIPSTSGSNLQPYITCYMWKRTA